MPFYAFFDSAEYKHVNGYPHRSWAIKAGLCGHLGSAITGLNPEGDICFPAPTLLLPLLLLKI